MINDIARFMLNDIARYAALVHQTLRDTTFPRGGNVLASWHNVELPDGAPDRLCRLADHIRNEWSASRYLVEVEELFAAVAKESVVGVRATAVSIHSDSGRGRLNALESQVYTCDIYGVYGRTLGVILSAVYELLDKFEETVKKSGRGGWFWSRPKLHVQQAGSQLTFRAWMVCWEPTPGTSEPVTPVPEPARVVEPTVETYCVVKYVPPGELLGKVGTHYLLVTSMLGSPTATAVPDLGSASRLTLEEATRYVRMFPKPNLAEPDVAFGTGWRAKAAKIKLEEEKP